MGLRPRCGHHCVVYYVIISCTSICKKTKQNNNLVSLRKETCLSTRLSDVILPTPSSSNCETKEENTTGLSAELRSSWDPAACTQRHSIDQGGLSYVLPRRRRIPVPGAHSASLRMSFTAHQLYTRIQSVSGGTDVQRFHMHTSVGAAMNGVHMGPHRGNHPSQREYRSQKVKNNSQVWAMKKESRGMMIKSSVRMTGNCLHLEIPALVRRVELWFLPGRLRRTAVMWQ